MKKFKTYDTPFDAVVTGILWFLICLVAEAFVRIPFVFLWRRLTRSKVSYLEAGGPAIGLAAVMAWFFGIYEDRLFVANKFLREQLKELTSRHQKLVEGTAHAVSLSARR